MNNLIKKCLISCLIVAVVMIMTPLTASATGTGSFHGTLKDSATMQGIAGVDVVIKATSGSETQNTQTGTDGSFKFLNVPVGTYMLTINSGKYVPADASEYNAYVSTGQGQGYLINITEDNDVTFIKNGDTRYLSAQTTVVNFTKTSAETGSALSGAVYELYDITSTETLKNTYTTNAAGKFTFNITVPGKYKLVEKTAPSGYGINSEPVNIDATTLGQTLNLSQEDSINPTVTINKYISGTTTFLSGAELQIKKGTSVIKTFTSGNSSYKISLAPGDYTLSESKTPAGYNKAADINFTVSASGTNTVTMYDVPVKVSIAKMGATEGGYVQIKGAHLTLTNNADKSITYSWESGTTAYTISGIPVGTYTLKEVSAPAGYLKANDQTIVVQQSTKNQEFVMYDEKDEGGVTFYKYAKDSSTMLPGAELAVYNGSTLIEKWNTTSTPKTIKLNAGNYILKELTAPQGYNKSADISFTVASADVHQNVTMYDAPITVTMHKLITGTKTHLSGAQLILTNTDNPLITYSWTSTEDGFNISEIPAGTYTWKEVSAPKGYTLAEEQTITVTQTEKNQEFLMYDDKTEAPSKPDDKAISHKQSKPVKTSDEFNVLLYSGLLVGSAVILGFILLKRKNR